MLVHYASGKYLALAITIVLEKEIQATDLRTPQQHISIEIIGNFILDNKFQQLAMWCLLTLEKIIN